MDDFCRLRLPGVQQNGERTGDGLLDVRRKFNMPIQYERISRFKYTPLKINIESENDGLEEDFPFPGVYSQVPCESSGVYLLLFLMPFCCVRPFFLMAIFYEIGETKDLNLQVSNEKTVVVWGIHIGDEILPTYKGIIINHYFWILIIQPIGLAWFGFQERPPPTGGLCPEW